MDNTTDADRFNSTEVRDVTLPGLSRGDNVTLSVSADSGPIYEGDLIALLDKASEESELVSGIAWDWESEDVIYIKINNYGDLIGGSIHIDIWINGWVVYHQNTDLG